MKRIIDAIRRLHNEESGHVEVGVPSLGAGIGAIVLAVGAASDSDPLIYIGGGILGVGIFLTGLLRHRFIDYTLWERLDKLEIGPKHD